MQTVVFSAHNVAYQIILTTTAVLLNIYTDGRMRKLPNDLSLSKILSLSLNYLPSVIAVTGYRAAGSTVFGILTSDSEGYVTSASWKCTQVFHPNWMLPDFDDTAWPAALVLSQNGDDSTAP